MLLGYIYNEEEYYVMFSMIEACYALFIIYYQFMLVRRRVSDGKLNLVFYDGRQDVPPVKTGKALLNCLQVYPCRWLILSDIMWTMYSILMLVCNNLLCFGVFYCPFQYGVVVLFCMPRMKKPPDPTWTGELTLVEGIIELNNLPCNKHFSYRKMRKLQRNEIETCEMMLNRELEVNSEDEKPKRKALEERYTHQVSKVKDALGTNPVIMLECEQSALTEFRTYAWIAGASTKLTEQKALILRSLLNSTPICVLSELISIIFDTGASTGLTPFMSDFKGKITLCCVKLQGIGSGLIAKGKGIVEYNFVAKDGKNVTIEASAYYVPDLHFRIFSPQLYFKHNKDAEFRMNSAGAYFVVNKRESNCHTIK